MEDMISYISLEALAATLRLPQHYLRTLVSKNQIPYLNVNGRLRFNLNTVQVALDKLAAGEGSDE